MLRQIVSETGLTEEIKWGIPVYADNGKNVVTINALKESANIGFFKGVLLTDKHKILEQQRSLQSVRLVRFTNINKIEELENVLKSYIRDAIEIERSGQKVVFKKNPVPIPSELMEVFEAEPALKKAFYLLTPGRQRGYLYYFSQPKQSQTRTNRIELFKQRIFDGVGLNDKYTP